ncbi:energy transducer TonB, partial [Rhizobium sp. CRIBSB]|nr:energy transducer TonB [Rhizobium sp. CRIBSB]
MTDAPVEYHRSRYDAPRKKGFMGVSPGVWLISLGTVSALFVLLIFWVQKTKFEMKVIEYDDESVKVDLVPP